MATHSSICAWKMPSIEKVGIYSNTKAGEGLRAKVLRAPQAWELSVFLSTVVEAGVPCSGHEAAAILHSSP